MDCCCHWANSVVHSRVDRMMGIHSVDLWRRQKLCVEPRAFLGTISYYIGRRSVPSPCPQELRVQRSINVVSEHDLSPSPCQCGLKTAGNSNRRINKVITNRELSDDIYCTTFDRSDVNSVWIRSIVSHWRYCRTSRSLRANREIQIER